MIVRINETRKQSVQNKTINGFFLSVNLVAAAVNTLLLKTQHGTGLGFDASQVSVSAILKRGGSTYTLMSDNLGILGQYNTLLSGAKNWLVGNDYLRPAAAVAHQNVRTVFLALGGHHNLKGADEIEVSITIGKNAFAASINQNAAFIDVNPSYSVGTEYGIMQTKSETIQAGSTRESFNLGDNVMKIGLLNFEDTDVTSQIVQTLQMSSDRLDQSLNLADLINLHTLKFGKQPFNQSYQMSAPTAVMDGYVPAYPQSFCFHDDQEVDKCAVDITFDGSKVNASKNALVYTFFYTSIEILAKAVSMEDKHKRENIAKLPQTI